MEPQKIRNVVLVVGSFEVLSGDLKLRTGSSDNQLFRWHELGWLQ